jgi:hypothetical protein
MNQFARMWVITPAGNVCVPDFFEPWFPPEPENLRAVHQYLFAAGVPVAKWEEWRVIVEAERISDIRSLFGLFTLWMLIMRWQYENKVEPTPVDEIGMMVRPFARDYLLNLTLTPVQERLISVSH